MSNPTQDSKKIPAVRTYAMDLEHRRLEEGLPPEEKEIKEKKVTKKVAATVVSAPKKYFEKHPTPVAPIPMIKDEPIVKTTPKIVPKVNIEHVTKNTTFIVDNEDAAEATVITDRKHDRFKFFPALFTSLKSWFTNKKESFATRNQPRYTVPESSRRKGVIQKATSASGKLTTADFSSIQERIRQRNEENKEEKKAPTTIWSANTEPGYLLLEGETQPQITNVSMVARKSFRTVSGPKIVEEIVVPTPVVEPEPVVIEEPEPIMEVQEVEPVEEIEQLEPVEEVEAPRQVVKTAEEKTSVPTRLKFLLINTNLLAVGVSGIVIALITVATVSYFRLNTYTENNPQPFFTPSFTELIVAPKEEVPVVSSDNNSFLQSLAAARKRREEVTQVVVTDKSGSYFSTQNILNLIQIPPEQNFKQSITEVRFGYAADSSPFIIIQSKDKTVALGGLLSWESTIHRDFNRTFSIQSFVEEGKFVDGTIGGHDIRVLKNISGAESLIYGVVGELVIITTDSVHFSELVDLIK